MNNDGADDFYEFAGDEGEEMPTKEELALFISEFMSNSQKARNMYRSHFCSIIANRIHDEFGVEGLCELMMAIDKRAGWISDIIIEDADIHDALFNGHGVYDDKAIIKARMSQEMTEMNKKIWRLRKKYSKLIAEEIFYGRTQGATGKSETSSETD